MFKSYKMDWSKLTLKVYSSQGTNTASAKVFLPEIDAVKTILLSKKGTDFSVNENPINQKALLKIEWIK
jgi:alpha-D-xyloside xylohydrolase